MISTDTVKELTGDSTMTEERAEAVRAACYDLIELVVAAYQNTKTAARNDADESAACSATRERATLETCKASSTPE
jgi:hypothetical protein